MMTTAASSVAERAERTASPWTERRSGAWWLAICGRVIVVGTALAGLAIYQGHVLLQWLLPYLCWVIELIHPQVLAFGRICMDQGQPAVCVVAKLIEPIPLSSTLRLAQFSKLPEVHGQPSFMLTPCIALITAVSAWPAAGFRQWRRRLVATLPCGLVLLTLTGAVQLAAQLDMMVDMAIENAGAAIRPQTNLLWLDVLLETGGTSLLTALFIAICIRGTELSQDRP